MIPLCLLLVQAANAIHSANVLVTGYGDFHGFVHNPAASIALQLNGTCSRFGDTNLCWEGWKLNVSREGAKAVATYIDQYKRVPWDAIIHLGLEDSAKGLKLEAVAMNVLAAEDNPVSNMNLNCQEKTMIARDGMCLLPTTAPLNQLNLPMINDARKVRYRPDLWSRDAGSYYCNEIYYRTLYAIRESYAFALTPVLFIHVPVSGLESIATIEQISYNILLKT